MFEGEDETFDIKLLDLSLAVERSNLKEKIERSSYDNLILQETSKYPYPIPLFRAPELLNSATVYDETVDIWSVGCILYNMVVGVPPFFANDETRLLAMISQSNFNGLFPKVGKKDYS